MKRIISDLKSHLQTSFNWKTDGLVILFVSFLVFLNYFFEFEERYLASMSSVTYLLYFLALYPAVYYLVVWLKCPEKLSMDFFKVSGIYILALSLSSGFIFYREWFTSFPVYEEYYLRNVFANLHGLFWVFIPLFMMYQWREKAMLPNFYGFSLKHNFWPYTILILLMIPGIYGATHLSGFLETYPTLKVWKYQEVFGLAHIQMAAVYEVFYLSDFIRVEALFRGALVIGLARFLGKDTIITMAAIYCVLHFNKPLGETISSFFGGYLLGTIAYYQHNIVGGCIVHVGIAGLMELIAGIVWGLAL